ncbi:MAG: hypothetical protein JSW52_04250 [Candidatus Coatesbacteria bacterium]|nr:MAG: hypothetical protein JSW52_04250 [Candidatus Coatesbacteria bacterium]
MDFGGRPGGPGGNDEFDPKSIYARLTSYSTNNKGLRSAYNKKLEMCLRSVAEFVRLDPDIRREISDEISFVVG